MGARAIRSCLHPRRRRAQTGAYVRPLRGHLAPSPSSSPFAGVSRRAVRRLSVTRGPQGRQRARAIHSAFAPRFLSSDLSGAEDRARRPSFALFRRVSDGAEVGLWRFGGVGDRLKRLFGASRTEQDRRPRRHSLVIIASPHWVQRDGSRFFDAAESMREAAWIRCRERRRGQGLIGLACRSVLTSPGYGQGNRRRKKPKERAIRRQCCLWVSAGFERGFGTH